MKLDDLLAKCDEEGIFIDSVHQKGSVSQDRWHVNLRAISKYDAKAFSYFPGKGSTFVEAFRQAAVNAGALTGRKSMEDEDMPKKRKRSIEDMLS